MGYGFQGQGHIASIRKKEFVYLSWAYRFWKKPEWKTFDEVMSLVKGVDDAVHQLFLQQPDIKLTDELATKTAMLVSATKRLLLPEGFQLGKSDA